MKTDKLPGIQGIAAIAAALPAMSGFYSAVVKAQAKREQEIVFFAELAGKSREELLAAFRAFPSSWAQFCASIIQGDM